MEGERRKEKGERREKKGEWKEERGGERTGSLQTSSLSSFDNFEKRGVSIRFFRALLSKALSVNTDPEFWNMGRVSALLVGNHEILKPESCRFGAVDPTTTLTFASHSSLIDAVRVNAESVRSLGLDYASDVCTNANVFISFAYANNFVELVSALEGYLDDRNATSENTSEVFFWFDMFVNSQWGALDRDFTWWSTTFRTAVQSIGETVIFLSPWDDPAIFKRAWCQPYLYP